MIPTDGSTINVFVDGVNTGHPTYNIYRKDIADLFPGYANSNGAIGYFYLDTTAYENGVHTIQWTAADDAGNTDGIGSRYFTIQNTAGRRAQRLSERAWRADCREQACLFQDFIRDIPIDYSSPIGIKKGFVKDVEPEEIYPDNEGLIKIKIKELERIEIHFDDYQNEVDAEVKEKRKDNSKFIIQNSKLCAGFLMVGNDLGRLPTGSTFKTETGTFYRQPGPGFIGEYRFVFIEKGQDMDMIRKNIIVRILPKFK
jgi:hypothetical protein